MTQKQLVEQLMAKYPQTRDSDSALIIGVLQSKLRPEDRFTEAQLAVMRDTNFESIRRDRQTIQNVEGKYLASPDVAKKRRQKAARVTQAVLDPNTDNVAFVIRKDRVELVNDLKVAGTLVNNIEKIFPGAKVLTHDGRRVMDWNES